MPAGELLRVITFQGHQIPLYKGQWYDIDKLTQNVYAYINGNNLWQYGCIDSDGSYKWPQVNASMYGDRFVLGNPAWQPAECNLQGSAGINPFANGLDFGIGELDPENLALISDGPYAPKTSGLVQPTVDPGSLPSAGIGSRPGTTPDSGGGFSQQSLSSEVSLDEGTFSATSADPGGTIRPAAAAYKLSATDVEAIRQMAASTMGATWDGKLSADEWCYFFAQRMNIPCPAPEDFGFTGAGRNERVTVQVWANRLSGYTPAGAPAGSGGVPGGGGGPIATAGMGSLGGLLKPQFLMLAGGAFLIHKGHTVPGVALIAFALFVKM